MSFGSNDIALTKYLDQGTCWQWWQSIKQAWNCMPWQLRQVEQVKNYLLSLWTVMDVYNVQLAFLFSWCTTCLMVWHGLSGLFLGMALTGCRHWTLMNAVLLLLIAMMAKTIKIGLFFNLNLMIVRDLCGNINSLSVTPTTSKNLGCWPFVISELL